MRIVAKVLRIGVRDSLGDVIAANAVTLRPGHVPVTRDFDPRLPPIGRATLRLGADGDVYAEIESWDTAEGSPAVAIRDGQIHEVSICKSGNIDPDIQRIVLGGHP